jgi:hypothetical protein
MMGANVSPPAGSSDRTTICWASRMAGGVRTPECENMVGIALEYRCKDGLPPGPAAKDDDMLRMGLGGIWDVEGRRGDPAKGDPSEDRLCGFDTGLPDIRPGGVGVCGRSSTSGISGSDSGDSASDPISESDSNGSSLSAFIAAATQRSAIFVTAFSFAINSL